MAAQAAENFSNQAVNAREPSMEEILASIRRIIEDSDGKAEQPYEQAANNAGSPFRAANSQPPKQDETASLPKIAAPAAIRRSNEPRPDIASSAEPPKVAKVEEARNVDVPASSIEPAKSSIISDIAGRQVAAAFGELTEAFAVTRRRSFDEIAEEMMRPMLQDWLDNNLPTLVERLVREEIERIARVGVR